MSVYEADPGRFTMQLRCFASDASRLLSASLLSLRSTNRQNIADLQHKLETQNDDT